MSIRTFELEIEGIAPYQCGKFHKEPKLAGESHADYDIRTFRSRAHVTPEGNIAIPAQAFSGAICDAAKSAGDKIPGKGAATWSKSLRGSMMIPTNLDTGVKLATCPFIDVLCHSDGKKDGSAGRVERRFPIAPCGWKGTLEIIIMDPAIPAALVEKYAKNAGMFCGVGTYAPRKGGTYGRFKVNRFELVAEE